MFKTCPINVSLMLINNTKESCFPLVNSPPLNGSNHSTLNTEEGIDLFGAKPFMPCPMEPMTGRTEDQSTGVDPFGMGDFGQIPSHLGAVELENAIGALDKRIIEMRVSGAHFCDNTKLQLPLIV